MSLRHFYNMLKDALNERDIEFLKTLIIYGENFKKKWLVDLFLLAHEINFNEAISVLLDFWQSMVQDPEVSAILLFKAIEVDNLSFLTELLIRNTDPNVNCHSDVPPLLAAVTLENLKAIQILLDHGANIEFKNSLGYTALMRAVACEQVEVVRMLLGAGASVHTTDNFNRTPLFYCKYNESEEILQMLLDHQADVNALDFKLNSPLIEISSWFFNRTSQARLLLQAGANVDLKNCDGDTALFWAVRRNKIELTHLLLEHKAAVNVINNNGLTPLMVAVRRCNLTMVKLLLENGANPNLITKHQYFNALFASYRLYTEKITKALLEAGANPLLWPSDYPWLCQTIVTSNKISMVARSLVILNQRLNILIPIILDIVSRNNPDLYMFLAEFMEIHTAFFM